MGVSSFQRLKCATAISHAIPEQCNLCIDVSSFMFSESLNAVGIVDFTERVADKIIGLLISIRPNQVMLSTDGEQPLQKFQEQARRHTNNNKIKYSYKEHKNRFKENIKSILSEKFFGKIFIDFQNNGEGEMKAIAFNGFDDPSLPKLVFARDNDVFMTSVTSTKYKPCNFKTFEKSDNLYEKFQKVGATTPQPPPPSETSSIGKPHIFSIYDREAVTTTDSVLVSKTIDEMRFCECFSAKRNLVNVQTKTEFVDLDGTSYRYEPHAWFKCEYDDIFARYCIIDVWSSFEHLREKMWHLCLWFAIAFGNDYVMQIQSGTQKQWLRILNLFIVKAKTLPSTINSENFYDSFEILVRSLNKRFIDQGQISEHVAKKYFDKLKWFIDYSLNANVCWNNYDNTRIFKVPISRYMDSVQLSSGNIKDILRFIPKMKRKNSH